MGGYRMLDIIICEDNEYQRVELEKIISKEVGKYNSNIALSTKNPYEVIRYVNYNSCKSYIYFLDIDLGNDITGIELARNLRQQDPAGYIIFVTSHAELTFLTFKYKVQALDYIMKFKSDYIGLKIKECIAEAHEHYKKVYFNKADVVDKIYIKYGNNLVAFNLNDILFFETTDKDHKIRVHACNEQIEFYGTLKEIEKQVNSDYYKTHRAFLVNTKNIKSIDKENLLIYMVNGEICYVSTRYLKGLIKKWIE